MTERYKNDPQVVSSQSLQQMYADGYSDEKKSQILSVAVVMPAGDETRPRGVVMQNIHIDGEQNGVSMIRTMYVVPRTSKVATSGKLSQLVVDALCLEINDKDLDVSKKYHELFLKSVLTTPLAKSLYTSSQRSRAPKIAGA